MEMVIENDVDINRQLVRRSLEERFSAQFRTDSLKALVASVSPEEGVTLKFSIQLNSALTVQVYTGGKTGMGEEDLRIHLPPPGATARPHKVPYKESDAALRNAYDVCYLLGHDYDKLDTRNPR